ncbi:hypothetical protein [Streptosporangium saharense]|uniref:hypothetical protein n=1 Tax=Streptosporangium saharense TaxID=1706840 RepID=UPI00342CA168
MFSVLSSRRIAATVAGAALLSFTAACGGSSNAAACTDAQKLFTDYTSATTASAGDLNKFNEANQKFSADLKALADKSDGDLASALNDFSTTWGNIKIDAKDPAGSTSALQDMAKKAQEAAVKLGNACSS